jgi:polyisoprenoid-binding protein YceI
MSEGMQAMVRNLVGLSLAAFAAMFCATPARAQSTVWVIDSAHSTARLFAASSNRKDIINIGVARMSGELKQDADNALPASFTFEVYPADQYPRTIQPGGGGSGAKSSPPWWDATLISFQSKSVEPVDENTLRVRGEITATYISRHAIYGGPSFRDYYGPTYGPPITHSAKQEVTFVFRKMQQYGGAVTAEWSGSTTVRSTEFPTLWNAVVYTTWPVFEVAGKIEEKTPRTDIHCVMPTTLSEGFYGELCSGTAMPAFSDPDEDRVPDANRSGAQADSLANEVQIKLDVYLVKVS